MFENKLIPTKPYISNAERKHCLPRNILISSKICIAIRMKPVKQGCKVELITQGGRLKGLPKRNEVRAIPKQVD
jgi:hypothetical protein